MDEEDEDHDKPEDFHDPEESLDGEAEVALAPREGYAIVLPIIAAIMVDVLDTPPLFHDKLSYDAYCAAVFAEEDIEIPKTFEEAMKSPYRNHWIEAMVSELLQFDHHGVFQEVTWHEGIRVLGTIWVYNIKRDANGKIIRFKALLVARGYMRATADACLYIKHSGTSFAIITLFVDDGLIASNDQSFLESELVSLHKAFKLKRLGPVSYFPVFEVHRTKDHILFHQRRAFTPMDDRPSLRIDTTPFADIPMYQSAVGSLQYASTRCRPDIAIAVRAVAQKNSCPTVDDWAAVKRIFRYLNSTVDWGILYRNSYSGDDLLLRLLRR
ncbi:BQ5605_C002g00999 [Microbotryum silenes-dioicae]|uniref:BQ5605_C002g00999 protein n=1 Tax=Microbotryum silenes-dioicae TaxID=796604 RepID=A0A2X0P0Y9_9BASI|nr:BQ5605_C002g00999 [Microbotryum silenes-dioicae]